MNGRDSLGGHEVYYDEVNLCWRYKDNNKVFDKMNERPCIKCGHKPTEIDDDFCLGHLGKVINACCGHGENKGYIQFDNGVIIRGYFEVERS